MKKHATKLILVAALGLGLSACGSMQGERALSGGVLGAAAGAGVGAIAGDPVTGAVVGGAAGTVIGATSNPRDLCVGPFPGGTDCPPRW